MQLIRSFMTHGHLNADLDPLKLAQVEEFNKETYALGLEYKTLIDYNNFGFTEADLDRSFYVDVP